MVTWKIWNHIQAVDLKSLSQDLEKAISIDLCPLSRRFYSTIFASSRFFVSLYVNSIY